MNWGHLQNINFNSSNELEILIDFFLSLTLSPFFFFPIWQTGQYSSLQCYVLGQQESDMA